MAIAAEARLPHRPGGGPARSTALQRDTAPHRGPMRAHACRRARRGRVFVSAACRRGVRLAPTDTFCDLSAPDGLGRRSRLGCRLDQRSASVVQTTQAHPDAARRRHHPFDERPTGQSIASTPWLVSKWNVANTWLLTANVRRPLTDTGLNADWVQSITFDYAFGGSGVDPRKSGPASARPTGRCLGRLLRVHRPISSSSTHARIGCWG